MTGQRRDDWVEAFDRDESYRANIDAIDFAVLIRRTATEPPVKLLRPGLYPARM